MLITKASTWSSPGVPFTLKHPWREIVLPFETVGAHSLNGWFQVLKPQDHIKELWPLCPSRFCVGPCDIYRISDDNVIKSHTHYLFHV